MDTDITIYSDAKGLVLYHIVPGVQIAHDQIILSYGRYEFKHEENFSQK